MPPKDDRLSLGCLSCVFLFLGILMLIGGLIALPTGDTVPIPRRSVDASEPANRMSPELALGISAILIVLGIAGFAKLYKNRNKYPF